MTEPKQSRMVVALAGVADIIGAAEGTIIKTVGDCVLLIFPEARVQQALTCLHQLPSSLDPVLKHSTRRSRQRPQPALPLAVGRS